MKIISQQVYGGWTSVSKWGRYTVCQL